MENQKSRSKLGDKPKSEVGKKAETPALDTNLENDTVSPDKQDAEFEKLGATRVSGPVDDSAEPHRAGDSGSNYTEISPSRVLGKNLTQLGDFQLIRKLGEGAMGAVYKAKQVSFNRIVALKILFPHVANIPKLVQRLYREGRVMADLDHPNIVQAYAIGEAEGCHYVAMEYISGQSLQKWLNQLGKIPVGDAVRITIDCAKALLYAHNQKIIHRDVKPDNILLTKTGIVKLADLGLVKKDDEEMSLTQTGHAVGTPWYMPIEQARNAKEIDGRCDIYALGCTLYAMLTGHPPFIGQTIVDVIRAKELGTFAPARQANANVPERLDLVIAKMAAKLPKNRYQSCDELISDLEALGLASGKLSIVQQKPAPEAGAMDTPMPGKTVVTPPRPEADDSGRVAAPEHDPDQWYVQLRMPDGTQVTRKYKTAQLNKMLTEGTIEPHARASHSPTEGFRALATYKEFQGVAMTKTTKKGADKTTAKYRGAYKKLEEQEKQREQEERAASEEETELQANTRYWGEIALRVAPILLAAAAVLGFFYWLVS